MGNVDERILDIRVRYDDAIGAIAKYQGAVDAARIKEVELKKQLKENKMSRAEYNAEMAATKVVITENNDAIRILNKQMQNERKEQDSLEGSLVSLRAKLSNLTAEYDKLSKVEREGDSGKKKAAEIKAITDELKGAEEETGRFYRNVGNYKDAMLQATEAQIPFVSTLRSGIGVLQETNNFIGGLKDELTKVIVHYKEVTVSANALSGAQRIAAVTSNLLSTSLKILKVALISTGIGAIVVLLGFLIAWLTKTQKGTEFLSNVMASFGAIINVLIDRIAKFGGAIVKFFSGDFSGAAKDMKDSFAGIGTEIANDTKQAWALNDAMQQLEKSEIMLNMKRAASRSEIERLKLVADDTTKSLKERTDAAQKAYDLENKLQQEGIDIGRKKLANLLGQIELTDEANKLLDDMATGAITADEVISRLGISESTVKDLKEFSQAFSDVAQKEMEGYTRNKETQNKINAMRKEAADKAKNLKDKEIAEVRKAEDELLKLVKDERNRQTQELNFQYSRQIEDLQRRLKTETDLTKAAKEAISKQIVALEQQKTNALQKLSDEQLAMEISNRQKLIETMLSSVKLGSEQEYQLKMQQLVAQRDAELQQKELTEQMKLAIVAKYNKLVDDLTDQQNNNVIKKQEEALKLRFETEIAQAYGNEQEILRIKMEQKFAELNSVQQLEGESIESFNLRKLEINNAYLDAKQSLTDKEVEIEQIKYQAAADITSSLSALADAAGEHSRELAMASKVLALAEIAINTGKAIAAGVAQAQSVPFPGNIAAIATTIATVLSNITTAINTVKSAKFADGGYVTGPGTSKSDSISAMLSNGESVMTASATGMFAPLLSAFNQMGGGIPINVTASSNQALGEDMLARAVAKGMMMAPAPVISIEEFNSVANRVKYLEELGNV